MKIQCDVCEKRPATVMCCADEAALCANCDVEVHAANKLASKHQRLQLHSLSTKLPSCDICQEKSAFIFCVEDRALFCENCDQSIHLPNTLSGGHQRYLATGIRVALGPKCANQTEENNNNGCTDPSNKATVKPNLNPTPPAIPSSGWGVDDLLHFSDIPSPSKKGELELGETDWWTDVAFFSDDTLVPAQVPQLPISQPYGTVQSRASKIGMPNKKARFEIQEDDEEFFLVPDLG